MAKGSQAAVPGQHVGQGRERLRQLIQPLTRSRLLVLPEDMRKAASGDPSSRHDVARKVMLAAAIEILLVCPLRKANLARLRIDRHLQRTDRRGRRISHIVIDEAEVKNEAPIEWPVPQGTADLLETWLTQWRPHLLGDDTANPYLFPGRAPGTYASENGLGNAITGLLHRQIGVKVNPHLLRHFAAWRHLRRHPGEYEIIRRVLGHRSIETTVKFYCGLEAESAARHFHAGLELDRKEARGIVALSRPRSRRGHRSARQGG
ncbi:tyrosine-type recombinase/integrase [Siccirubricoccus deserti]